MSLACEHQFAIQAHESGLANSGATAKMDKSATGEVASRANCTFDNQLQIGILNSKINKL